MSSPRCCSPAFVPSLTGGVPLSPRVAAQLIRSKMSPSLTDSLSERERHVLRMIVEGRTNAQIGTELGVSRATVTSVCGRIFKRLDVSDRTQAAVWAMRNLPPESGPNTQLSNVA